MATGLLNPCAARTSKTHDDDLACLDDGLYQAGSRARVAPRSVERFVDGLLGEDMHAKRVLSIALAVTGVQ